jgi:hypothetical protein
MASNIWTEELKEILKLKSIFTIENTNLVKELDSLLNAQDEVVALLYSRRALEVIVTEICLDKLCRDRGNEPLLSIIDRLVKDKAIPEFIHSAMHNLNRNAIYGAHPKDFDPRQVRTAIIELLTILDWYFKEKDYKKVIENIASLEKPEVKTIIVPPSIQKKNLQDEKPNLSQPENEASLQTHTRKRLLPIFISIVLLLLIFIAIAIFFVTKKNPEIKAKPETTEKNIINTEKEKMSSQLPKPKVSDIQAKVNIKEIKINKSENAPEKQPASLAKPITQTNNLNKPKTQETVATLYSQQENEEDIDKLFRQVTDMNLSFAERKNISQKLKNRFEKNASITIKMEGIMDEHKEYGEYIDRLLLLKGIEVIIQKQEKSGSGKIKLLEVVEKRK